MPPRHAFTQGLGTVFQFVGVVLFLILFSTCFASSLLSRDFAERPDLTRVGWHFGQPEPIYSAQRALAITLPIGALLGIALAALGLGLQATHRKAPLASLLVTLAGAIFWLIQSIFTVQFLHARILAFVGFLLAALFLILAGGAYSAYRELSRDPPPTDQNILPSDYKIPYSHLHNDPPEVRLAAELDQRKRKLEIEQKEIERLEALMKRKH